MEWTDKNFVVKLARKLRPRVAAVVGVQRGNRSKMLLKDNPQLHLTCVDHWSWDPAYAAKSTGGDPDPEDFRQWYWDFLDNLGDELLQRVNIIRESSVVAARYFRPHVFDLVFIDATHTYEALNRDIRVWQPTVRHNGILCGHDYGGKYSGVKAAVEHQFGGRFEHNKGHWWKRLE